MTKTEFEQFRELEGKMIDSDISFAIKKNHPSMLTTSRLPIANTLNFPTELEIHYIPDADAKIFTILLVGEGPICRLCVDNGAHRSCASSHKHCLVSPQCPSENLKTVVLPRPDLDGKTIEFVFSEFCALTKITHKGTFNPPSP
jgi:hypothetical protein